MPRTFRNPILPGFYPDPSVCRVGEDYYLVTSSFEYFPGVPLFHSRDLVHWQQIGHVLDRPSQLNLDGVKWSYGIYAPTIRHHNGLFYMITSVRDADAVDHVFVVTAENPAGDWSDPHMLVSEAGVIDPSLFFDDDGSAWMCAKRIPSTGEAFPGHREIWLQAFDPVTMQLTGPVEWLWEGAVEGAVHAEAPHIYKVNGRYYLMIAEGGTDYHHAVTIARSDYITGPYVGNPANPILTHRHLGRDYPIVNPGHADLIQTQNGEWWMVLLASRPYGGYYRNLGRETFLVPVRWEDEWPVVSPGTGRVEFEYPAPDLPETVWSALPACDHFERQYLDPRWNFLRTPREEFWSTGTGRLRLRLRSETITEWVCPSFVGQRICHMDFAARTRMTFLPEKAGESAGMVLMQNSDYHYRFIVLMNASENTLMRLIRREDGRETVIMEQEVMDGVLGLKVQAHGQLLSFAYAVQPEDWTVFAEGVNGRILSTDMAGGFVGAYIGLYATSSGERSSNFVDFDYFEYRGIL